MTESNALTTETARLLELLGASAKGTTATELMPAFDGRPVSRLNHLAKLGFAWLDSHQGRWWITHKGFAHLAELVGPERERELIALWSEHDCDCAECRAFCPDPGVAHG